MPFWRRTCKNTVKLLIRFQEDRWLRFCPEIKGDVGCRPLTSLCKLSKELRDIQIVHSRATKTTCKRVGQVIQYLCDTR